MMFAIPLAALKMVMAVSFLTVLNPSNQSYGVAWPILIALTVDTLVVMVSNFYSQLS